MYKIPLSVPCINGNEWKYIKECLDTEWVSSAGKYVDLFEEKVADYTGSKFAVACINGTSAIQVSLRLAGVSSGDEVIVPTLTFIAPINAIYYNNANPVFMDADKYYNIDTNKTIEFIKNETIFKNGFTYNKITNKRISAIVPVHVWGNPVWMDELILLCEERNISVVEDASESLGSIYKQGNYDGKHTGIVGKLGCLSFNGNKIITTGGGGMILTNDEKLANKARYLTTQAKDDPKNYIHNEIGYNFRLNNIQSALGLAQLEQLDSFLYQKREIYVSYKNFFRGVKGLKLASVPNYGYSNHWMNILHINYEIYKEDRQMIMQRLEKNGIETRPLWALNHLQKPYKRCQAYNIEKAEELMIHSLCLPSSANLTDKNLDDVFKLLKND